MLLLWQLRSHAPVLAGAEPMLELDFDQTVGWKICAVEIGLRVVVRVQVCAGVWWRAVDALVRGCQCGSIDARWAHCEDIA